MKYGVGSCYGTFGELVQGVLQDKPFLITLPIPSLKSTAFFMPRVGMKNVMSVQQRQKAVLACEKVLQHFGIQEGGYLYISSNIPHGKGMASSSADITAAIRAVAQVYSLPITEMIISRIASEIEPTDGVMYEGSTAYNYLQGELIEMIGTLPPFIILGLDAGGSVDTIAFNTQEKEYSLAAKRAFQYAYELVKRGIEEQDFSSIRQAATISAQINQHILPHPYFQSLKECATLYKGGVVVAHSGTVAGLLLEASSPYVTEAKAYMKVNCPFQHIREFSSEATQHKHSYYR